MNASDTPTPQRHPRTDAQCDLILTQDFIPPVQALAHLCRRFEIELAAANTARKSAEDDASFQAGLKREAEAKAAALEQSLAESIDKHYGTHKKLQAAEAELAAQREHARVLADALKARHELSDCPAEGCGLADTEETIVAQDGWREEYAKIDRQVKAALATSPAQIASELADLRAFREWCYANVGNDDFDVLRELLTNAREDKSDLDWLNASDGRGVNRLEYETEDRKGHVFDNARLVRGVTECDHYYGSTVRAAIRAARKAVQP